MNIIQELEQDLYLLNKKEKKIKKLLKGKDKTYKTIEKALEKLNYKINPLKIKYGRENVLEIVVKNDKFGYHDFTRNSIQKIGNDLSNILHKGGVSGLLTTAMKFNNYYRNSRNTNIGEDIDIFDVNDYEYHETEKVRLQGQNSFGEFRFYIMRTGTKIGKRSENNDCLYNCLLKILLDDFVFKTPIKFKEFLKIERNEGVHIDKIKNVEEKLNISINVSGDYIYTSVLKTNKQINLKLINNHYTIDYSTCRKAVGVSYKERNILLYDKMADIGYDGVSMIQMSKQLLQDIYTFRCAYIVVSRTEFDISIQNEFDNLSKNNIALKKATNGFINLGQTGSIKKTSLFLFERLSVHIPNPEHISQIEMVWIENASLGAIIFSEDYEGEAWKYDVKSMYPSIMCSKLLVPMKKGEFKNFTLDEFSNLKFYPNGIYRAVIKASTDIKLNRLFRFNKLHYYTQISLTQAQNLGLIIELIIDDQPNSLLYSRDKCLRCDEMFSKFVDYMFDLKTKKFQCLN